MAPGPRSRTYACLRASDPTGTLGRRPRALVAALAGVMALALQLALAPVPAAGASTPCPTAIAHRGNAVYGGPAENSLGAFQSAFASGATWVETDVLFTSDNVPVLMHDSTVDRTTTGADLPAPPTSPHPGASARSHTDTGLDDTTAHVYEVTALDAAGLEGPPSASVTRSLADTVPPTAATGLVRTITGYTVRLTWAAASDNVAVTGYTVYRAGVAIGTTTGATTYTDATAPPGKTYAYTVRANDAAGNLGASSASVSATLPADTVKPTAPSGLKAVAGAAGTRRIALT